MDISSNSAASSANTFIYPLLMLTSKTFERIVKEVKQSYPKEACGIMGGVIKDGRIIVSYTSKLSNVFSEEGKFWFSELDWMHKVASLISHGLNYIGLYHSHPDSTPTPSLNDLERMIECPGEIWLILSYTPSNSLSLSIRAWTIPDFNSGLMRIPVVVNHEKFKRYTKARYF